ncbi:hypothetical protein HPB50_016262 [Hyalomma asiaticum]|uniref:Uncharacterized protein n=1 Tax=Hyalomma asiaticum TaxID=266040 RepID=A0ACB7THE1_HYAAI|nr:hypothetical protein HPB50_016262 [Hyalomma asiaticum]
MHCFCKAGFAGDASDVESCNIPAEAEMMELWCAANGDGGTSELQEFLYTNDTVTTNELTDEVIVTVVTGTQGESGGDDDKPEPVQVQVMSHQEASLLHFVFVKNLPLGHVQHLDSLQQDVSKLVAKQSNGSGLLASEAVAAVPLSYAEHAQWHLRWPASTLQDETGGSSAGGA